MAKFEYTAENRPIRLGLPFQRSVIKLMLQEHAFCLRACDLLHPTNFQGTLAWFFTIIKDHVLTFGTIPSDAALTVNIAKHDYQKQIEYTDELKEIMAVDVHPKMVKAEMTDFIRANLFVDSTKQAAHMYNHGDPEEAYSFMRERLQKIVLADFNEDMFSRFGNFKSDLARALFETQNAIPTGIGGIDEAMGGLLPGTLTVFLGASNVGKSMLAPNLAYFAAKMGKRVYVTVHEDEENPTKLRYLSRFSGIEMNKLRTGTLSAEDEVKLERADKLLKEFVVIRFMYTTNATVEAVLDSVRSLHKEWPFELFICDYGQCLRSTVLRATEKRHVYEHVYSELKQICLELNICGASMAQVNRSGTSMSRSGADFLRMTDVGESFGIAQKASNVITINRSEEDKRKNRVVFLLDKVRNGVCPKAVACVSDYSRCMTHTDDVGMQSIVDVSMGPGEIPPTEEEKAQARADMAARMVVNQPQQATTGTSEGTESNNQLSITK